MTDRTEINTMKRQEHNNVVPATGPISIHERQLRTKVGIIKMQECDSVVQGINTLIVRYPNATSYEALRSRGDTLDVRNI